MHGYSINKRKEVRVQVFQVSLKWNILSCKFNRVNYVLYGSRFKKCVAKPY